MTLHSFTACDTTIYMFYRAAVAGSTLSVCAFEGLSRRETQEVTSIVALPLASPEPQRERDAAAKNE